MGRWTLRVLALLALAYMTYDLLLSDHGYLVYRGEQQQLEQLQAEIETMHAERERLAQEILRLRNDPKALEELVHRELGYVYPDEYMLILPDDAPATKKREEDAAGE